MSPTTRKELLRDYIAGKTDHWLSWEAIDRIMAIACDGDGDGAASNSRHEGRVERKPGSAGCW